MAVLSICMVSLNCRKVLEDCLESLRKSRFRDFEIICVDNGSTDGTIEYLRVQSDVRRIENDHNVGFTKGTNQAVAAGSGRYVLWLNTDTVVRQDSLDQMIDFLRTHARAGVVGPKVLNGDGSFQPQCKRGNPTPMALICYSLGLDRVWPSHRIAGRYLLRSVPENATSIVDAVSGCCLMTRREVIDEVGPLDEEMFGFGEDLDWCVRVASAGWEVWYHPGSVIVHLKGRGGAHAKPYRKILGMHGCMWVFYRKHLKRGEPAVVTLLVVVAIAASLGLQMITAFTRGAFRQLRSALA